MVKFERLSGLWNYRLSRPTGTFFYVFYVFFKIQKTWLFYVFFELPHVFSNTAGRYCWERVFKARWDRDSGSSSYDSLESLVSYEIIWCHWVKRFPSNEGIKEGYSLINRYFTTIGSSGVKTVAYTGVDQGCTTCLKGRATCKSENRVMGRNGGLGRSPQRGPGDRAPGAGGRGQSTPEADDILLIRHWIFALMSNFVCNSTNRKQQVYSAFYAMNMSNLSPDIGQLNSLCSIALHVWSKLSNVWTQVRAGYTHYWTQMIVT